VTVEKGTYYAALMSAAEALKLRGDDLRQWAVDREDAFPESTPAQDQRRIREADAAADLWDGQAALLRDLATHLGDGRACIHNTDERHALEDVHRNYTALSEAITYLSVARRRAATTEEADRILGHVRRLSPSAYEMAAGPDLAAALERLFRALPRYLDGWGQSVPERIQLERQCRLALQAAGRPIEGGLVE